MYPEKFFIYRRANNFRYHIGRIRPYWNSLGLPLLHRANRGIYIRAPQIFLVGALLYKV